MRFNCPTWFPSSCDIAPLACTSTFRSPLSTLASVPPLTSQADTPAASLCCDIRRSTYPSTVQDAMGSGRIREDDLDPMKEGERGGEFVGGVGRGADTGEARELGERREGNERRERGESQTVHMSSAWRSDAGLASIASHKARSPPPLRVLTFPLLHPTPHACSPLYPPTSPNPPFPPTSHVGSSLLISSIPHHIFAHLSSPSFYSTSLLFRPHTRLIFSPATLLHPSQTFAQVSSSTLSPWRLPHRRLPPSYNTCLQIFPHLVHLTHTFAHLLPPLPPTPQVSSPPTLLPTQLLYTNSHTHSCAPLPFPSLSSLSDSRCSHGPCKGPHPPRLRPARCTARRAEGGWREGGGGLGEGHTLHSEEAAAATHHWAEWKRSAHTSRLVNPSGAVGGLAQPPGRE